MQEPVSAIAADSVNAISTSRPKPLPRLVKIDRRKLLDLCRRRLGGRISFGRDLAKATGVTPQTFARWVNSAHARTPLFNERLQIVAGMVGVDPDSLLERDLSLDADTIAAVPEAFWRDLGLVCPDVSQLPDEAVRACAVLIRELTTARAENTLRTLEAADQVFRYFDPEKSHDSLRLIESVGKQIRKSGKNQYPRDLRSYRLSVKALVRAARGTGFGMVRRDDLTPRSLLSFVYSPRGNGAKEVVVVDSKAPERTLRFEIAKLVAWKLLRKHLDKRQLPDPPRGALNFKSDEELRNRRTRHEFIARAAAAAVIPEHDLRRDLQSHGLDLIDLARKYGTSIEVVARRVVAVAELGSDDPAKRLPDFHFMKIDRAGNLIHKVGGHSTGIVTMRRGTGVCARWAAVKAFESPLRVTMQWGVMPTDTRLGRVSGRKFFCAAVVVNEDEPAFGTEAAHYSISIGCPAHEARTWMVYASHCRSAPVEIGPACAICPRVDCNERAARNADLDDRNRNVQDPHFSFARKRRPWSPFTDDDLTFMKNVVATAPAERLV